MEETIKRIEHFEDILNRADEAVKKLLEAVDEYKELLPEIRELDEYYQSDLWQKDFTEDEEGLLPDDLKRGVLSEDGIYNLLQEAEEAGEILNLK